MYLRHAALAFRHHHCPRPADRYGWAMDLIERAFQLARSGRYPKVEPLIKALRPRGSWVWMPICTAVLSASNCAICAERRTALSIGSFPKRRSHEGRSQLVR